MNEIVLYMTLGDPIIKLKHKDKQEVSWFHSNRKMKGTNRSAYSLFAT